MGMLDLDSEYALLRATADRAWEIEKRLGMSITMGTLSTDDPTDWRMGDISRSVATRIAHVATWMKDPKERSKRLHAAEIKRAQALVDDTQDALPQILPRRIADLAKPKTQGQSRRLSDVSSTSKQPLANTASTIARQPKKTWTRPKPAPPIAVDLPWETTESPRAEKADSSAKQRPLARASSATEQPSAKKAMESSLSGFADELPPSTKPEQSATSIADPISTHEESSSLPVNPVPQAASVGVTHRPPTPPSDAMTRPASPPSMPRPMAPPPPLLSSIGPQVLSSHRSMPSAAFGYGTDAMWSAPFLRRLFNDLDGDRDGLLTKLETSIALHRLHVYVPPSRISTFFAQAANLSASQRSVVNFRQFHAFVLAAKEANWQPPPPTKPVQTTALPQPRLPLVLDNDPLPLNMEQALPEVIVARVLERMDDAARSAVDPEVVRQIAWDLMQQHIRAQKPKELRDPTGLDGVEAELTAPPAQVDMTPVAPAAHAADLVKEFLLEHMRQLKPAPAPPAPAPAPPAPVPEPPSPRESPPDAPGIAPPSEPVVEKAVATMEQATSTSDLIETPPPAPPANVAIEVKDVKVVRNLADLPGKTLLGKLLHCDAIGECNVQGQAPDQTSLASTLRRMRATRLRRSIPSPPPMPPRPLLAHVDANVPPPPAPPLSPPSQPPLKTWQPPPTPDQGRSLPRPQHQQPPALVAPSLDSRCNNPPNVRHESSDNVRPDPLPPKMYTWNTPSTRRGVVAASLRSSVSSHSIASSVDDENNDDLLSEGEVLRLPDSFSDGEVDTVPAHMTFYHLHQRRAAMTRQSVAASNSSMEDGQLQTLFMPVASSVSSSTGSIESGEFVPSTGD